MKKILVALFSLIILIGTATNTLAVTNNKSVSVSIDGKNMSLQKINVNFNDKSLSSDVPPLIYDERTIVPIRFVAENLNAKVSWNNEAQEATIKAPGKDIVLKANSSKVSINGKTQNIPYNVPAKLVSTATSASARTMVPLRFVSETLGCEVAWDQRTLTASIKSEKKPEEIPSKEITSISIKNINNNIVPQVHINANGELNYTTTYLENPSRLLIDVDGVKLNKSILNKSGEFELKSNNNIFKSIRASQLSEVSGKETVRVIVDLQKIIKPQIVKSSDNKNLTLTFANSIKDIKKETINGKEAIVIDNAYLPKTNSFSLSNPDRIVLDIRNTDLNNIDKNISTDIVSKIRLAQYDGSEYGNGEKVTRVVFDINENYSNAKLKTQESGDKLLVYLEATKKPVTPPVNLPSKPVENNNQNNNNNNQNNNNNNANKQKVIVIDAGHGGSDGGASSASKNNKEKDLALKVALKTEQKLKDLGYKVIMTRSTDVFKTLGERPEIANNNNADAFVSIHFNSATVNNATGVETYYALQGSNNPKKGQNDYDFAKSIQDELIKKLGVVNRGTKSANHAVTRNTKTYAALTELGFINNPKDEVTIVTEDYLDKCAEAIANGVHKFFSK